MTFHLRFFCPLWVFLPLFCLAPSLHADPQGPPAGIVLYAETEKGVQLLMADHLPPSKRGWAAFGGAHEGRETPAETAARETEEETHGYFKKKDLLEQIGAQKPFFDGPFAFFFVKVAYVPVEELLKAAIPEGNSSFRERGPYAWIPFDEVAPWLKTPLSQPDQAKLPDQLLPKEAATGWLWAAWLHNMRAASEAGALPWASGGSGS